MDNNNRIFKRCCCYKCDESALQNLNINSNASNSTIAFWNPFQIYIYENFEFESAAKIIIPEFEIRSLLLFNNYLVCLDRSCNIHVSSLKFKNPTQKRLKACFEIKEQCVLALIPLSEDYTLSLKCESCTYSLLLNRTTIEFKLVRKLLLICTDDWQHANISDNHILHLHSINKEHLEDAKNVFKVKDNITDGWRIILISFDKLVIYGGLFNPKMTEDQITLVKLYVCPSEICSLYIINGVDIRLTIGLTIGTLIRLSLIELHRQPDIVHLNIAISKLLMQNNTALYTDGASMWKTEDTFSAVIEFNKLCIKNVKDFIKFGDQIVCTTYTNLIYTFQMDDENTYIKQQSVDEYYSAEKLFNSTEYLQKIMEEVDNNNELIKKINKEGAYLTALSLSNRQDVMDTVISCKATVYDNYCDAITDNADVKLTEYYMKYHLPETIFVLIIIATTTEHKLDDVLSSALGDLKVHFTFTSDYKVLKITSVKIMEQLKKLSILIPLQLKNTNSTQININVKLMSSLPGVLDPKHKIWAVLYKKNICLSSVHFIKTDFNSNSNLCLKEEQRPLEELIVEDAFKHYGNLFELKKETRISHKEHWPVYVRLPDNYRNMISSKEYYEKKFNSKKTSFILQQFSSDDFFSSKSKITFVINNEKVVIEIKDDGFSNPLLKVTSEDMRLALNVRDFFSNVIYNDYISFGTNMECISATFYTIVENLKKAVQDGAASASTRDELLTLFEQFERHVVGGLPI